MTGEDDLIKERDLAIIQRNMAQRAEHFTGEQLASTLRNIENLSTSYRKVCDDYAMACRQRDEYLRRINDLFDQNQKLNWNLIDDRAKLKTLRKQLRELRAGGKG